MQSAESQQDKPIITLTGAKVGKWTGFRKLRNVEENSSYGVKTGHTVYFGSRESERGYEEKSVNKIFYDSEWQKAWNISFLPLLYI